MRVLLLVLGFLFMVIWTIVSAIAAATVCVLPFLLTEDWLSKYPNDSFLLFTALCIVSFTSIVVIIRLWLWGVGITRVDTY